MSPTWDILIPTIPHRDAQLRVLLAELDCQWRPGLGVRIYRDNLERPGIASYAKWGELVESSQADYVCIAGDDDMVAPDFVARVMTALEEKPDYVGFPVRYTVNGGLQKPVEHSLRHRVWEHREDVIVRDITQFNPVRRELALMVPWRAEVFEEDRRWADGMRALGLVQTEVWIDEPMYYYQVFTESNFTTSREPMPEADIPALPVYPWLTALGS